jgi:hypothetical protein
MVTHELYGKITVLLPLVSFSLQFNLGILEQLRQTILVIKRLP